ncbi:PKD domain-containing protein, partial [Candidatus Amoebophilus asiaticus]|nr:PKD domain-containing protein [Candidatus Amoebophilus asiaticus]
PTYIYQDTGIFDVTLIVSDAIGCTDTLVKTSFINVRGQYAKFSVDTNLGCTPLTVQFSDSSAGTSPIVYWIWNYGDSSPLDTHYTASPDTSHIYTSPGDYTVTLTVIDTIDRCQNATTLIVSNTFPTVNFVANDTTPCQVEVVTFTNSSSGASPTYYWDYGDGTKDTVASTASQNHFYSVDGIYTITLVAVDTNGCTDSLVRNNYLVISDPVAGFFASDTSGCYPLFITFTDTSFNKIQTREWSFGDGASSTTNDTNTTHAYTYPGDYDIQLIITDSVGCKDTIFKPGFIDVNGPLGSFTYSPDTGCVPFDVSYITVDTFATYYTWDFGDGTIIENATDSTPTHTYLAAGVFHPKLIMFDTNYCPLTLDDPADSIIVDNIIPQFTPTDTSICDLFQVDFVDKTTSMFALATWNWNFGDGNSASTQNTSNTYADSGVYQVILTVENIFGSAYGCIRSDTNYVTVYRPPVLNLHVPDTNICVPYTVFFRDTSGVISPITSWLWDFDDGSTSTAQHPPHEYTQSGFYNASLTVTYGDTLCTISLTTPTTINAYDPPIADFSINDTITGQELLTVDFFDSSVVNNIIGQHFYSWNFGDVINNTSTDQNPTHIYIKAGLFTVQLIVTNAGCADTITKIITVRNTEDFEIPNVFTPHPITPGNNDKFFIKGLKPNSKLIIFNRWGQKVYEHPDY